MTPLPRVIYRASAVLIVVAGAWGCSGVAAAKKCDSDLGTSWAGNACINAVQDPSNQSIVKALGDKACARARVGTADSAVAQASCEEARAKVEKAAWIQIEKGAKAGQPPNLDLDSLLPGLPAEPAAPASRTPFSPPAAPPAPSAPEPIANSTTSAIASPPSPSNVLIVNPAAGSPAAPPQSSP